MLRMISGCWGLQKDPWGLASVERGDSEAAVALCLCTLSRAGLLISAQGYINDVSTVAAIHHAERRFRWSRPSVSREPAGEFRDEKRKEERGMEMYRRHNVIVAVVVDIAYYYNNNNSDDGDDSGSQQHHSSRARRDLWEPAGRVTYKSVRQTWELTLYTRMRTDFPGHRHSHYIVLCLTNTYTVYMFMWVCVSILNV